MIKIGKLKKGKCSSSFPQQSSYFTFLISAIISRRPAVVAHLEATGQTSHTGHLLHLPPLRRIFGGGGGNSSCFNHNSIDGLHPEKLPLTQDCYIQSNINKKSNKELPLSIDNRFGLRIAVRGSNCIINETKDEQRTLGNCFECAYGLM